MTRQVTILLLTVAALSALVGVAYVLALRHADDPFTAERVELVRTRLLRDIESLKLAQEQARRTTAVTLATLRRREAEQVRAAAIQSAGVVVAARTIATAGLYLMPYGLLVISAVGAGVYAVTRRTMLETPYVKVALPVRQATALVERSLTISNASEYGRALAFSEEITRARLADTTKLWASLRGGAGQPGQVATEKMLPSSHAATVPTFAALWQAGDIGKGKPLLMGFTADGQPQHRTIKDIKAMSVAGQQGAGKTASMAYLITSTLLLADDAEAFIVDPHWQHAEGLGAMIRPLTQTGRLHLINPMDLEATIDTLDQRLDRRLAGIESSAAPVLFCVDELAKMGKNPLFAEKLLPFVERFTEETRKAGMIGVFGSQKWNARHFCNKADIRATIPSLLIHKIKPSQADLLLEDADNKKMMKAVNLPGQALMATSHDADPSVVTMPLITRADIEQVARRLSENHVLPRCTATGDAQSCDVLNDTPRERDAIHAPSDGHTRCEPTEPTEPTDAPGKPGASDVKQVREAAGLTQGRFADVTGCSLSKLKRVEVGGGSFSADEMRRIMAALNAWQTNEPGEPTNQEEN